MLYYFHLDGCLFGRTMMETSTCYKIPTVSALIGRSSWLAAYLWTGEEAVSVKYTVGESDVLNVW